MSDNLPAEQKIESLSVEWKTYRRNRCVSKFT